MRRALLILLLVGCEDGRLSIACPETCYSGPEGTQNVGECSTGIPRCNSSGEIVECVGEYIPHAEKCDGLDNDCSGIVDDGLHITHYDEANTCKQEGPCSGTPMYCHPQLGWRCDYPPGYPRAEECNGVDDDCSGIVDDNVFQDVSYCYDGPPDTAVVGECQPGIRVCSLGRVSCQGQTVPRDEQCDDLDNDCDGMVDNVLTEYDGIDMVIAIDFSGSMGGVINVVKEVVCSYATGRGGTRFALVGIGVPSGDNTLIVNLGTSEQLCTALSGNIHGGGEEPTLDAADVVSLPSNPMGIDWTPGHRRIFVGFADERAQSTACGPTDDACLEMVADKTAEECAETDTQINWVVSLPQHHEDQAQGCDGQTFWLFPQASHLSNVMDQIVSEVCLAAP